VFDADENIK
jgi:hypothetical protein